MKKRILVLGASGLVGHQVFNYLDESAKYEVFGMAFRRKLNEDTILQDVRNEKEFLEIIEEIQPSVIVNCIGILIPESEANPENAIFINSYLPHRIAQFSKEISSKLIHISTDCVFSGDKGGYREDDFKDGRGIYATSKGLGEVINDKHLTLRTSIVGPEMKSNGEGLFHWFMSQDKEIYGYTQAMWSGVTTLELSKTIKWAIENNVTGLYHVTNNLPISKYELLCLFKKETNKNININPVQGVKTNKSFIDTRKEIDYKIPNYDVMVHEMVTLIKNRKDLYKHYQL